jgi:integrase
MFMGWPDVDLTAGIVTVQAKNGFSTKNRKSRQVPIPKILVEALKTYKTMYPERKTSS